MTDAAARDDGDENEVVGKKRGSRGEGGDEAEESDGAVAAKGEEGAEEGKGQAAGNEEGEGEGGMEWLKWLQVEERNGLKERILTFNKTLTTLKVDCPLCQAPVFKKNWKAHINGNSKKNIETYCSKLKGRGGAIKAKDLLKDFADLI